jgi:solute carrier family 25 protein 39/40
LQDLGISFLAGSVSGVVAATATHPFDVLKTILQVTAKPDTNRPAWKQVYITRGFAGFWVGLFPRIAKAAPACGIMISSYELGKRYLGELSS